jgi:hypothetical protein
VDPAALVDLRICRSIRSTKSGPMPDRLSANSEPAARLGGAAHRPAQTDRNGDRSVTWRRWPIDFPGRSHSQKKFIENFHHNGPSNVVPATPAPPMPHPRRGLLRSGDP